MLYTKIMKYVMKLIRKWEVASKPKFFGKKFKINKSLLRNFYFVFFILMKFLLKFESLGFFLL